MNPAMTIIHKKAVKKNTALVMYTIKQSHNPVKYVWYYL